MTHQTLFATTMAILAGLASRDIAAGETPSPLQGTWTLVAADKILTDGTLARDYGEHPKGRMTVDADGRYALQIFKAERVLFAREKPLGTPEEFRSATLGSSTHYGTITVDETAHVLLFTIEGASYPNWEGTQQRRTYEFDGAELRYWVPPRADGSVPVSIWRRL